MCDIYLQSWDSKVFVMDHYGTMKLHGTPQTQNLQLIINEKFMGQFSRHIITEHSNRL